MKNRCSEASFRKFRHHSSSPSSHTVNDGNFEENSLKRKPVDSVRITHTANNIEAVRAAVIRNSEFLSK